MALKVKTATPGSFKRALNEAGWLEEEVLAAGHLRQGDAYSLFARIVKDGFPIMMRPRRSKSLPRHFVLAVTANEVVAFKATEAGGETSAGAYDKLKIKEGVAFRYPRESVSLADLPDGYKSLGGNITIDGETFPVMRPNRYVDPNTDELMSALFDRSAAMA